MGLTPKGKKLPMSGIFYPLMMYYAKLSRFPFEKSSVNFTITALILCQLRVQHRLMLPRQP